MKKIYLISAVLALFFLYSCKSCNNKPNKIIAPEIKKEDSVKISIKRYEKALFSVDTKNLKSGLKRLLPEYCFFIPENSLDDTLGLIQMKKFLEDPFIQKLYKDCIKSYPDLNGLENQLGKAFTYYKHYYPEKRIPQTFSCISGLYFEEPIRFADSVLIISLDMYMGTDYKYYKQMLSYVPIYIQKRFRKEYILTDCMRSISKTLIDNSKENKKLLDYMIYEGKVQYFIDAMLPETPDSLKIYYSAKQLDWCDKNESSMWTFLIDKKLLYSSENNIVSKLCTDGPFTALFSKQSPSRVGYWLGWQIVRSYMENNKKVSMRDMFKNQDAQEILEKSKYKPKKN